MKHKNTLPVNILRDHLMFDFDTGKLFWLIRAKGRRQNQPVGTVHPRGYRQIILTIGELRYRLYAHRVAYALHYGKWPEHEIDHINGDKDDNRISNLRVATDTQNKYNKIVQSNNQSGLKWVKPDKPGRKNPWRATVVKNGKEHSKFGFGTKEEAYAWASSTAKQLHGPFFNAGQG